MTQIYSLNRIKAALRTIDPVPLIEQGFVDYTKGRVVVPPVGEMIFEDPPGDVHIKYGYIKGDAVYVIKIASGFYQDAKSGLVQSNGLMLVFSQKTGEPESILLDEGLLTNIRTAAAGAVAAKYLAPGKVNRIGILGAGTQGRVQLQYLKHVVDCDDVIVWGIHQKELDAYLQDMASFGFRIETTLDASEVAATCNLIVTATPSTEPLLKAGQIRQGTHITAVGSDTPEKNELHPEILQKADLVVADSVSQCLLRGEIHQAIRAGCLDRETIVELGSVIEDAQNQRTSESQITVADLTGVAVQDIQISKAVCEALRSAARRRV